MDPDSVSIDGPYLGPNLGERTFCRRRTIPRSSFEVDYKSTPDIESALPKNQYLKREIVYVFLFYVGRGLDFVDCVFTRFMVILENIDYCKQLFSLEYWLEECLER
jgi:hypothetical protein